MTSLLTALDKMQEVLSSLAEVMNAEQEQLSAGRINSSLLQRITEDKSSLLGTLNYLDEMRRQTEQAAGLQAPYSANPDLARRWNSIQSQTMALRDTNQHNGMLLNQQINHTEQALAVLKPHQTQAFYGPDGQTQGSAFLSRKV